MHIYGNYNHIEGKEALWRERYREKNLCTYHNYVPIYVYNPYLIHMYMYYVTGRKSKLCLWKDANVA